MVDPTDYGNAPGSGPLRPAGQTVGEIPRTDRDLPSTRSKASERQMPDLTLVRDVKAGQRRLHEQSTAYLPRDNGEAQEAYDSRLSRSWFFNAFGKAVEGLVGFVFRKDPALGDDVPPVIVEHWENIDNAGTHGDVFCRELLQDVLAAGHAAILVDFPKTDGNLSAGEEADLKIRPYWVPIQKENIYSWRSELVSGRRVLSQVVIRECTTEPDGEFGEKEVERYRVLYRQEGIVGFRLLEVQ
jgi:hypothetical protein